jgi:hypothetical protein
LENSVLCRETAGFLKRGKKKWLLGCGKKMSVDEVGGGGKKSHSNRIFSDGWLYHSKKIIIKTIDMTFLMRYI